MSAQLERVWIVENCLTTLDGIYETRAEFLTKCVLYIVKVLENDFSKVAPESLFILSENLAVIFRGISPAVSQLESRQNHQRGRKMTVIGAK